MNLQFLTEYLKDFRHVGAIAPSSRFLAQKMVASIDFNNTKLIVEYGPGTGVFTAEIIERMRPDTRFIAIESNQSFYEALSHKYKNKKNIEILHDSAEHIVAILQDRSLSAPNTIISGLPFAALPDHVTRTILTDTSQLLHGKGEFITFQYTLLKRKMLENYFDTVITRRELRNIPPAHILYCT